MDTCHWSIEQHKVGEEWVHHEKNKIHQTGIRYGDLGHSLSSSLAKMKENHTKSGRQQPWSDFTKKMAMRQH